MCTQRITLDGQGDSFWSQDFLLFLVRPFSMLRSPTTSRLPWRPWAGLIDVRLRTAPCRDCRVELVSWAGSSAPFPLCSRPFLSVWEFSSKNGYSQGQLFPQDRLESRISDSENPKDKGITRCNSATSTRISLVRRTHWVSGSEQRLVMWRWQSLVPSFPSGGMKMTGTHKRTGMQSRAL